MALVRDRCIWESLLSQMHVALASMGTESHTFQKLFVPYYYYLGRWDRGGVDREEGA